MQGDFFCPFVCSCPYLCCCSEWSFVGVLYLSSYWFVCWRDSEILGSEIVRFIVIQLLLFCCKLIPLGSVTHAKSNKKHLKM